MNVIQPYLLPEEYQQSVSENYVLFLLEKVFRGHKPNKYTIELLKGCLTVEEVITRISESDLIQELFLKESYTGLGRLGEFYIALRCGKEWAPRQGFDIWGAFEYHDLIEVGKVEVKTCSPTNRSNWGIRITDTKQEIKYDVLVLIGMLKTFNPCQARIFVIPKEVLIPIVEKGIQSGNKGRIRLGISTNQTNSYTGKINRWYEYECPNHVNLVERITQYIHNDFVVTSEQLPLFDLSVAMATDD